METKSYKEAAKAIRRMGRACILERIEMIKKGESFPDDLLTHMLDYASKSKSASILAIWLLI